MFITLCVNFEPFSFLAVIVSCCFVEQRTVSRNLISKHYTVRRIEVREFIHRKFVQYVTLVNGGIFINAGQGNKSSDREVRSHLQEQLRLNKLWKDFSNRILFRRRVISPIFLVKNKLSIKYLRVTHHENKTFQVTIFVQVVIIFAYLFTDFPNF